MAVCSRLEVAAQAKHAATAAARRAGVTVRVVVAAAVIEALSSLDLRYPEVSKEKLKQLSAAKKALLAGR